MRTLVTEDRPKTADLLRRALESEGHSVLLAYDGERALKLALTAEIDVILLDLMLPRMDGLTVLRKLRDARLNTPVIIVSARDAGPDIVQGLDSGADDYLTKPFELDVLLARVRAVSRRAPALQPGGLVFRDLKLKPATYQIERGDRTVSLTRTEYILLETLVRRAGTVVPRQVLIEEGWGPGSDVSDANLYFFVRALRSKITGPGEEELLHTVRGVGYSIRSQDSC
ncbi:MAG TPA: response regulator transcription factor [Verrucomicrobiae bacterium]|nr:response regulator transcription factor [Verrucomicrobiae bacterium]